MIRHFHERCFRLIHDDRESSYDELLRRDKSVSIIHHRNTQSSATEKIKIKNEIFSRDC